MKTINMEYLNAQHDFFLCALIALLMVVIAVVINLLIARRLNNSAELTEVEIKRIVILNKIMSGYGVILILMAGVTVYYLFTYIQVSAQFK
ncbi:hypothetical protein [Lactobacillus crispatus]|uniref:hypothetical protein n=1 Tax=Lactobacillus crispatus TaxID=47770 RepID=UPI00105BACEE|nr:hypothetical protein [Lactobacillus crispatus]TDM82897.1 hypothetical protein CEE95_13295 [Lactobacillus crispatus]TDM94202.1 hypothetical protein CEE89_12030 [Lactobacillus crispatus]TDN28869.1 hypothetical protein CEE74_13275 [Lactobacillus crispatus]